MVTHFVEEVVEAKTICGLTSLKDRPDDDTSLDINDCTCQQCLSMVIDNLTKRLQNAKRESVLQVENIKTGQTDK